MHLRATAMYHIICETNSVTRCRNFGRHWQFVASLSSLSSSPPRPLSVFCPFKMLTSPFIYRSERFSIDFPLNSARENEWIIPECRSIGRPTDFRRRAANHWCFIMCRRNYAANIQDAKLHLARNPEYFRSAGKFDTLPQIRRIEPRPRDGTAGDALVKCTHVVAPQYTTGVISLLFPALTRCGRGSRVRPHTRVRRYSRVCAYFWSRCIHTANRVLSPLPRMPWKRVSYRLERERSNAQFNKARIYRRWGECKNICRVQLVLR